MQMLMTNFLLNTNTVFDDDEVLWTHIWPLTSLNNRDTLTVSLTVSSNERYMTAQFWAIQKTKEKD